HAITQRTRKAISRPLRWISSASRIPSGSCRRRGEAASSRTAAPPGVTFSSLLAAELLGKDRLRLRGVVDERWLDEEIRLLAARQHLPRQVDDGLADVGDAQRGARAVHRVALRDQLQRLLLAVHAADEDALRALP